MKDDENIEGLSDILETEFESKDLPMRKQTEVDIVPVDSEKLEKDLTKDYLNVRGNMKELIDQGQSAIDGILSVANDTDSPRAYEVAAQMIKTVSEMNKDLLDLHSKMKNIRQENVTVNNNTTNALYVGSTSDLQDLINQSRSSKKAFVDQDEKNDE
jgi:hypothetical protein|tara:strand:+ start:139 stop:609 length:471 start_codon:yes stop_codon:yes gene_type:complete